MVVEQEERGERDRHDWWRVGFGAFLGLAFAVGLYLSVWTGEPAEIPDATVQVDAPETEAPVADQDPEEGREPEQEPTPEPTEDPTELIATAEDPAGTTVQVLDAGGGGTATQRAAQVLRDAGYDVVNVTSARGNVTVTTVLHSAGSEAEAAALRARDDRFAEIGENERFSDGVNLHVLVAPDFS